MRQSWMVLLLLVGMVGCVSQEEAPPAQPGQTQEQGIINGNRDFARQAVVAVAGRQSICSGTIVQTDPGRGLGWVLTAAHCVDEAPVAVLQGNNYENADETYSIVDYAAHPAYDPDQLRFDFAVVVFAGATANTPVIPIQASADGLSPGDSVTSVGYGRTTPSDQADTGNSLRYQIDRVLSDFTDDQSLVYSLANGGICQGDSGGPVLVSYNGVERVVAVHSAVTSECRGLGFSARVSAAYDSWIRGQLSGQVEETCDLCRQTALAGDGACSRAIDACFNNSRCSAFADCINGCSTDSCANNCATTYSDALDLYQGIFDCVCDDACADVCSGDASCPEGPSCGFQFQDTSCNGCMEAACCSQAQRCADDNNCFDCLGGEGSNCSSNTALSNLSSCLEDRCAEACGIEQPACGFTAEGTCGTCLEGSCCAQGAACGEDSLCSSCLTDADADPDACAANAAYNRFVSCLGACGGDPCGVGSADTNNGDANNGGNNGDTNNGGVNNGGVNNGGVNNGGVNNGDVNNGANNGSFVNNGDGGNNGGNNGAQGEDDQDGFVDGGGGGSEVSTCAVAAPAAPASAPWGLLLLGLLLGLARRRA